MRILEGPGTRIETDKIHLDLESDGAIPSRTRHLARLRITGDPLPPVIVAVNYSPHGTAEEILHFTDSSDNPVNPFDIAEAIDAAIQQSTLRDPRTKITSVDIKL